MKVLVWQAYGHTRVFAINTPEDYEKILDKVEEATSNWGVDEDIAECREGIKKSPKNTERFINGLVGNKLKDHESFEVFEFCEVQIV